MLLSPVLILVRAPFGNQLCHELDYYSDFSIKRSNLEEKVSLQGAIINGELFETNDWNDLDKKIQEGFNHFTFRIHAQQLNRNVN